MHSTWIPLELVLPEPLTTLSHSEMKATPKKETHVNSFSKIHKRTFLSLEFFK